jgi:hypothetical protein
VNAAMALIVPDFQRGRVPSRAASTPTSATTPTGATSPRRRGTGS